MHQGRIPHVWRSGSACSANELLLKLAIGLENSLPMIEAVFRFNNQEIPYKDRLVQVRPVKIRIGMREARKGQLRSV